jgi:hypothetical protein
MDPLSGSFAAESFRNGNPLALSCGSMASVCSSSSQSIPGSVLMIFRILSRLREEHPLVSRRSALYPSNANLRFRVALQSFKTFKHYAKQDLGLLLTFISTSGTSRSKIVETSSRPFSSNFPRSLVLVVISFTASIWNMTTVLKSRQKRH